MLNNLNTAQSISLDHTFAAPSKAVVVDAKKTHSKLLTAMLTAINEKNQVIAWVSHSMII